MDFSKKEMFGFIPRRNLVSFALVTVLFLMWGIPNSLNDILIKQFMKSFDLSRFQAALIQSAFYTGYFIFAIPSAIFIKRYSYKAGLVTGLLLFATGCTLFYPAAIVGKFELFLFALFVIASGLTFLETGANLFIVRSGAQETSERRLNFSQAFNPIGAILGVLGGTFFILSGVELDAGKIAAMKVANLYRPYVRQETMRVVLPYLVLAGFAVLWSLFILVHQFPKRRDQSETAGGQTVKALWKFPHFYNGVLAQFFYCGAQTCTWSFFIPFVQDYTGRPERTAGYFLTGTLVAFGAGRFSATYLMRFIRPGKLLGIYGLVNIGLVCVAVLFPGMIGVWALFFTSFFMSPMYPTNFALSIRGLGSHAKIGGAFLVMAIVGGAVLPPLMGLIAVRSSSMALALAVPLVAYLYITYYGFYGSAMREQRPATRGFDF